MRVTLPLCLLAAACQPTGSSMIPFGTGEGTTTGTETNYPDLPGELAVFDGELVAPDKRIRVSLGAPGVAWAACTLDGTPTETVIAESTEPALEHELKLLGLGLELLTVCTSWSRSARLHPAVAHKIITTSCTSWSWGC